MTTDEHSRAADALLISRLRAEVERLKGAIAADDERLTKASVRVWGEYIWGCDTAEHLADAVLDLRAEVERLKDEIEARTIERDYFRDYVERLIPEVERLKERAEKAECKQDSLHVDLARAYSEADRLRAALEGKP